MSCKFATPVLSTVYLLLFLLFSTTGKAQIVLKPNGQNAIPLRVKALSAKVLIDGQFSETHLALTFQNETSERIEADFMYALPPDTLVTSFAYWYGDERVPAKIMEKEEAAAIYAHITTRMRDPALIEMVGKNKFRARIFPVMPNSDLKVEMTLVQALSAGDTRSGKDRAYFNLPLQTKKGEILDNVDVRVHVNPNADLLSVRSSNGLPVTRSQNGYNVALKATRYRPEKDLRIDLIRRPQPLHTDLFTTIAESPWGYFTLTLTPDKTLTGVKVNIAGVQLSQVLPSRPATLKAHQAFVIVGRYQGSGAATVTVTGQQAGQPVTMKRTVVFGTHRRHDTVATKLWASRWMEALSAVPGHRAEVIKLSRRHGMPSKYTSWLAVPRAEMERYEQEIAEAKLEVVAHRLGPLILAHREDTPTARRLRAQLNTLCRRINERPQDILREYYEQAAMGVAQRLMDLKFNGQEHSSSSQRLTTELNILSGKLDQSTADIMRYSNNDLLSRLSNDISTQVSNGQDHSVKARKLKSQFNRLVQYMHLSRQEKEYYYPSRQLRNRIEELAEEIAKAEHGSYISREYNRYGDPKIYSPESPGRPDPKQVKKLRAELNRLTRAIDQSADTYLRPLEIMWKEYDIDIVRTKLLAERENSHANAKKIQELEHDFIHLNTEWKNKDYAEARAQRLVVKMDRAQVAKQIASAKPADIGLLRQKQDNLEKLEDQLRTRMGDPLISIEASPDAVQVIALMPGGEIKRLVYDHAKQKWEARFDIPTYATEGEYVITVVIVLKDGSRKTMQIHYHVDLTSPTGKGNAQIATTGSPVLRLQLDAAEDTARVKALLPWGELVELRPSAEPHRFFALIPVSAEHQKAASIVKFILTDKAHNRTTVVVDMTR